MKHPAQFIAVDGEGLTVENNVHLYTLLASSTGDHVENETGLDSYTCFKFLLQLQHEHPRHQICGFSFNYDINMMLGDIPRRKMQQLWQTNKADWSIDGWHWYLEWFPSKIFTIARYKGKTHEFVRIWDVFGFFQKSFVKTLEEWKVGDKETIAAISSMKDQRGTFDAEMAENVKAYCFKECDLLVQLMDTLEAAMLEAGIELSGYHGAGAAASALMTKNKVKQYLVPVPDEIEQIVLGAYFGGRTEIYRIGPLGTVYNYDLNSAYPSAAVELPSMKGTWHHVNDYDPTARYALWHVEWNVQSPVVAPFPFRLDGRILYSQNGRGWYHAVEVSAALRAFPGQINVLHGVIFEPDDGSARPFEFVRSVYRERRRLKDAGSQAEKPLKLGINSIYGKLAQGYGRDGKRPAWQQYYWAGLITATTRSHILDVISKHEQTLVGVATDGIFVTQAITDLAFGKELGQWEGKQYDDFFSVQPGVYSGTVDGTEIKRNRGFTAKELDFNRLRSAYAERRAGAYVAYHATRFVGYGTATPTKRWRTWHAETRGLTINYGQKFPDERDDTRLVLGRVQDGLESEPYRPKHSLLDFDGSELLLEEYD